MYCIVCVGCVLGDGSCVCVKTSALTDASATNGDEPRTEMTGSDCDPVYRAVSDGRSLFTCCRDSVIRRYSLNSIQWIQYCRGYVSVNVRMFSIFFSALLKWFSVDECLNVNCYFVCSVHFQSLVHLTYRWNIVTSLLRYITATHFSWLRDDVVIALSLLCFKDGVERDFF